MAYAVKRKYACPKCKGELKRMRGRGRKKQNYQHFQCWECGFGVLSEYDPRHLRSE